MIMLKILLIPQSHLPSFFLLSPQNVLQPTSISWHLSANSRGERGQEHKGKKNVTLPLFA
jgi:hypothetical protein